MRSDLICLLIAERFRIERPGISLFVLFVVHVDHEEDGVNETSDVVLSGNYDSVSF